MDAAGWRRRHRRRHHHTVHRPHQPLARLLQILNSRAVPGALLARLKAFSGTWIPCISALLDCSFQLTEHRIRIQIRARWLTGAFVAAKMRCEKLPRKMPWDRLHGHSLRVLACIRGGPDRRDRLGAVRVAVEAHVRHCPEVHGSRRGDSYSRCRERGKREARPIDVSETCSANAAAVVKAAGVGAASAGSWTSSGED